MSPEDRHSDAGGDPPTPPRRVLDLDVRERRRVVLVAATRTVVVATALVCLFYALSFEWSPGMQIAVGVAVATALIVGAGFWQVRSVATADLPEIRALEVLAFSATLLLVLFAGIYLALSNDDSAAFSEALNHTTALYFALTTLTTVGFGDIAARSDAARVTVMLQMVADIVVLGVLIKVIVAVVRRRIAPADD